MFRYCPSFTEIDFFIFDSSLVTDMYFIFFSFSKLSSFNLSNLNIENVTDLFGMFQSNWSLTSLELSNLILQKLDG